jgi:lipopolysaccharide/colanic/teichoic acid biosynthesis glycosyltransferase
LKLKRIFDVIASAVGLIVCVPVLVVTAALIKLEDRGPVFYRGARVGRGGRPFRLVKFRTMVVGADKLGPSSTSEDDPRITRIGRVLRRGKLDEMPQLLNVLIGDMSLVGPRPQVPWAVELYTDEERELLTVRPGITDYASIKFSNEGEVLRGSADPDRAYLELIAPEKHRLGLEYVRNRSFLLDVRILAATLVEVAGGNGEVLLRLPPLPSQTTRSRGH